MMKNKVLINRIVGESFWKSVATVIGELGSLAFIVVIARYLKPEGFGLYNLTLAIALIFIILVDAGINPAVLRYVSYSLGRKNKSQASSYVRYILRLKLKFLLGAAVILISLAYPLSFFVFDKPELFVPILIISLYMIVISLGSFFGRIFYAIKRVKYIALIHFVFQITRLAFAILVFALLTEKDYLVGLLSAIVLVNIISLGIMLVLIKRSAGYLLKKNKEVKIDKKRVWSFIGYLTIGGISGAFLGYIDILMLGTFLSSSFVGYYSAAISLVFNISGLLIVSSVLLPVFTQLKKNQIRNAFDKVYKYSCLLAIPAVFGILVLGKYFIRIVFGADYSSANLPFKFLSFLIFSAVLTSLLVSLFSAREKPKYFVKVLIITSFANILLNYILIRSLLNISAIWATAGAAIATLISRYSYLFALVFIAKRELGVRFRKRFFVKPLIASLVMFGVLLSIDRTIGGMNLVWGIGGVFVGLIIYFPVLFLIGGVSKEDIEMIYSSVARIFRKN